MKNKINIIGFVQNKLSLGRWLNLNDFNSRKGFSLVELLVIVSIISIMSSASVAGFGRIRQVLQFRESASVLSDVVKQEELKVLRGDFERVVIHFLENYLVIHQIPAQSTLSLSLQDCLAYNPMVDFGVKLNSADSTLVQSGEQGVIQTRQLKSGDLHCQTDFNNASEREISYQLSKGSEVSEVIRFVHFNLKRDPLDNFVYIAAGDGSRIELVAPYSKHLVYNHKNQLMPKGSVVELKSRSGDFSEKITLQ